MDRGLQLAGGRCQLGLDEQQVGAQATGRRQPLQGVRRRGMTARAARHVAARQGHAPGQQEAPGAGLAVATLQVLEALGLEGQLGLGHGELVGAHSRRPGGTGRPFCIHSTTTMTAITSTAIAAPPQGPQQRAARRRLDREGADLGQPRQRRTLTGADAGGHELDAHRLGRHGCSPRDQARDVRPGWTGARLEQHDDRGGAGRRRCGRCRRRCRGWSHQGAAIRWPRAGDATT